MAKRFSIAITDSFKAGDGSTVTVYRVKRKGQHDWEATAVWYSGGKARCCSCSSALAGMSASCEHARAVNRRVLNDAKRPRS